ncbi:MAG: bifunctional nuclease domain-containing protein [Bacteroidota bacterium]|jgi:bifunctional DNase/RNase|uniref:bifunctional nuclease family protein n=1 Tax=Candidatus Pollutiaquabacter sp. TaxID=3416354 RepID=UPI001A5A983C|nr:bifunctional nuclease family protein [Bacteroidota bacterium]MBL7947660.1 bifunctional nuclease family protein [Bacteroidia bacterium]MBP6009558.1 bifunctional nuclease family protein [Bacteroidia bacterium]MBP7269644.1 bifunctional nuclease family protein [Bacteroidia bacterium]MBP7437355.1 bifunctional nuclease family protein [Bacteroidia bacterium]
MKKIKLDIIGLSYSQTQSGAYALVLGEEGGKRRLPIIIGAFEAQAIAIELENMTPTRPLTHDLFKSMAGSFDIDVEEVIIFNLLEGVFYAKLICNNGEKRMEIDARTSDAIAIAVRFGCPIYTYEFILSTAGIIVDESAEGGEEQQVVEKPAVTTTKLSEGELSAASTDELNEMLTKALEEEAYERASRIRDELNKRKSN